MLDHYHVVMTSPQITSLGPFATQPTWHVYIERTNTISLLYPARDISAHQAARAAWQTQGEENDPVVRIRVWDHVPVTYVDDELLRAGAPLVDLDTAPPTEPINPDLIEAEELAEKAQMTMREAELARRRLLACLREIYHDRTPDYNGRQISANTCADIARNSVSRPIVLRELGAK